MGSLDSLPRRVSETYLRDKRYQFFKKYMKEGEMVLIATGHNRDDNIETLLMRLAGGSRLKGLLAIPPKRDCFIRPLLQQARNRILAYAKEHDLDFRQDASNFENLTLRNKIRNVILPYLQQELNLDFKENLGKTMEDLAQYHQLLQHTVQQAIRHTVKKSKKQILLDRKRYRQYLPLIRRGLLEYCISSTYPLNYNLLYKNFSAWDNFVTQAAPGKKYSYRKNGISIKRVRL